nr:hypothetical protein [Sphingomonas sp. NBWT7]
MTKIEREIGIIRFDRLGTAIGLLGTIEIAGLLGRVTELNPNREHHWLRLEKATIVFHRAAPIAAIARLIAKRSMLRGTSSMRARAEQRRRSPDQIVRHANLFEFGNGDDNISSLVRQSRHSRSRSPAATASD